MKAVLFADDPQFWFETLRTMGHAAYGGADIGEVLTTAQNIVAGDYESWHDEWLATADRLAAEADTQLACGHRISARDALMRASNYYRAAEFFLHGDPADARIAHAYHRATRCFQDAAALFTPEIGMVEIPYEDTVLHGYFYRAADSEGDDTQRPTMVLDNGFDGPAEEMHYSGAAAGVERGYHVVTFDGPGQGAARHVDGLVFRPDWENVVTPVLDWVMARPEVDRSRVGLLGLSMGGLLAPRAAAFDHRLAVCVAVDGIYELASTVLSHFPGSRAEVEAVLRAESVPEVDALIQNLMAGNPTVRWAITNGMYVMGVDSPRAFAASYFDYTLAGGIAEQITCPTLVCDGEADMFWPGQPQELFDHLTCAKTLLRFTGAEGADTHSQFGAQRLAYARIYDWLDNILTPQPTTGVTNP